MRVHLVGQERDSRGNTPPPRWSATCVSFMPSAPSTHLSKVFSQFSSCAVRYDTACPAPESRVSFEGVRRYLQAGQWPFPSPFQSVVVQYASPQRISIAVGDFGLQQEYNLYDVFI